MSGIVKSKEPEAATLLSSSWLVVTRLEETWFSSLDVLKITVADTDPSSLIVAEVAVGRYGVIPVLSFSRLLGKVDAVGTVASLLNEELEPSRAVDNAVLSLSGSDTGTLVDEAVFSKGADEDRSLTGVGVCPVTDDLSLERAG